MKKNITALILGIVMILPVRAETLLSPGGKVCVEAGVDANGTPVYSMRFEGKEVIRPSRLGFELGTGAPLLDGFTIHSVKNRSFDETWTPVWGEEAQIRNHYNEMLVCFEQKSSARKMNVRFRAFTYRRSPLYASCARKPGSQSCHVPSRCTYPLSSYPSHP